MDLGLEGKVALVTGGSRLIGRQIVRRLALEGAQVVTCARDSGRLEAAIAEFERAGLSIAGQVCDVRDSSQVQMLMNAIRQRFGGLDILVNNASGGVVQSGAFSAVEPASWRLGLELNLMTVIEVSQAALPLMRDRAWARIINFGAFYMAPLAPNLYRDFAENVVAKLSVSALTKVMSDELAPHITVNCVAPGPVGDDHEMLESTKAQPIPRDLLDTGIFAPRRLL